MFRRTNFGLSNQHLFFDVDVVVYCEGGETEEEEATFDELFWKRVFEGNGKRVTCRSSGNKTMLMELAHAVSVEDVENVVVAMDRDYDHIFGRVIEHPRVIYTYGYSWESDVISHLAFVSTCAMFANVRNIQTRL